MVSQLRLPLHLLVLASVRQTQEDHRFPPLSNVCPPWIFSSSEISVNRTLLNVGVSFYPGQNGAVNNNLPAKGSSLALFGVALGFSLFSSSPTNSTSSSMSSSSSGANSLSTSPSNRVCVEGPAIAFFPPPPMAARMNRPAASLSITGRAVHRLQMISIRERRRRR